MISLTPKDGAPAAGLVAASAPKYGVRFPEVVIKSGQATDLGNQTMKETGSVSGTIAFHILHAASDAAFS